MKLMRKTFVRNIRKLEFWTIEQEIIFFLYFSKDLKYDKTITVK